MFRITLFVEEDAKNKTRENADDEVAAGSSTTPNWLEG